MWNSSLIYEILLYLNSFYFGLFAACETGMGILKAVNLTYPEGVRTTEAAILVAMLVIETVRIILGRQGSLAQRSIPVFISTLLTYPSAAAVAYFLVFQEIKLRLEYILCSLMLVLQAVELFFAYFFALTMWLPPSYD